MATFDELKIDLKYRAGNHKVYCPNCHDQRKNKADKSLSVSLTPGVNGLEGPYNCHNCGFSGFATQHKPDRFMQPEQRQYRRPKESLTPLFQKTIDWFKGRKISETTLQYFKITESMEVMPAKQIGDKKYEKGERRTINFNYYREGELINIKYRDSIKCFKMAYDAELIFYNLDALKKREEVLICEGEIDCLSFYEAGYFGSVSVPNGASKGNSHLQYLDNCWEAFEDKTKIILATDGDEAGLMLRDELARRLGKNRCWLVVYPEGCKDANDVLVKFGPEALKNLTQTAQQWPIEGIESDTEISAGMDDVFENGFPIGEKLGYPHLDEMVQWRGGQIVTVIGESNSGKSAMVDQVMIRLSKRAGWKWVIFSFEQQPTKLHTSMLAQQYIGLSMKPNSRRRMSKAQWEMAKQFIIEHFIFIKLAESDISIKGIIEKSTELIKRKGIRGVMVDPWNEVEHRIPKGMTETLYVSEALTDVRRFKDYYSVNFILIVHPRKAEYDKKTGKIKIPTLNDAAGSNNFKNKTDIGLCVYRDFQQHPPGTAYIPDPVFVFVQKVRYDFDGRRGTAEFIYDFETRRYTEVGQYPEPILDPSGAVQMQIPDREPGWKRANEFPVNDQQSVIGQFEDAKFQNGRQSFYEVNRDPDKDGPF